MALQHRCMSLQILDNYKIFQLHPYSTIASHIKDKFLRYQLHTSLHSFLLYIFHNNSDVFRKDHRMFLELHYRNNNKYLVFVLFLYKYFHHLHCFIQKTEAENRVSKGGQFIFPNFSPNQLTGFF